MQKKLINNSILIEDFQRIIKDHDKWNYFKNSRILITGSTGFIASYLIKFLVYLNTQHKLNIILDCVIRSKKKADKVFQDFLNDQNFKNVKVNFIKLNFYKDIKIKPKYNFIIHTASIASPSFFTSNPIETSLPNTLGTIKLLEFSEKNNKLKKFIFFSTTGVNGFLNDNERPAAENKYGPINHLQTENCYLESKRMGESLCNSWFIQKKIPINIVRPAITYGPGINLDDERSYSDFISKILNNQNIILKSDGKAIRNFCYISDFINGLFYVTLYGELGCVYNLSSETEISIKDLSKILCNKVFKEKKLKVIFNNKSQNIKRINFNKTTVSTLKARMLGWQEYHSVESGFKRTIQAYEKTN